MPGSAEADKPGGLADKWIVQYVEFIIGHAVLTPPIQRDGRFLAGERVTLGEESFVVTRDEEPPGRRPSQTPGEAAPADVRRVPVVEAWQWPGPVIDREFKWPAPGDGADPAVTASPAKPANRKKPESKRTKPHGRGGRPDPQ